MYDTERLREQGYMERAFAFTIQLSFATQSWDENVISDSLRALRLPIVLDTVGPL